VDQDNQTQRLLNFLDGSLSGRAQEELLDELQANPSLRREFESLQALARSLEDLPEESPPANFARDFMAAHASPSMWQRIQSFFAELPGPAIPSLALAGGLAAMMLIFGGGGDPSAQQQPLAGCVLVADAGSASINGRDRAGEVKLHLEDLIEVDDLFEGSLRYPDGTEIRINAGSQVIVKSRGIRLEEGGVWLDVTKDLKGFKVETPLALAAVKGTAFSVLYDGLAMVVKVTEGLVEVSSALNRKLLGPGKSARVGANGRVESKGMSQGPHRMFGDASEGGFNLEGTDR
jgi:ferric-dicitrate binding protein FerR (iron transport regulator)